MSGKGACTIYVGRVGDPGLYLVWEPGTPVNLETVTVNLGKGIPMVQLWQQNQKRDGKEVERYNQAERDLGIGSAKRGARGSWQPGPVTTQVPTGPGKGEEIREIRDGGANGSIIGRNTFQRPREEALAMLDTIIKIYQGKA